MRQSEQINELAKALSAAQGEMSAPKKDKVGKIKGQTKDGRSYEYEYRYADLADVFDAVRAPFAKHGLSFMQPTRFEDGVLILETVLMHESGQWKASEYPIPLHDKPQEMGSELTYGRRYSACNAFGIAAEEDDDGTIAQQSTASRTPAKQSAKSSKPDMIGESIEDIAEQIVMISGGNTNEVIARASAFYGKDHPRSGDDMNARERWQTDAPFEKDVAAIKDLGRVKSEKWKAKTLVTLRARLEDLQQAGDDPARDPEAEAMQATFDEPPF